MAEDRQRLGPPKRRQRLRTYLRTQVQAYRVATLIRCGQVQMNVRGRIVTVRDPERIVRPSDVLYLRHPLLDACRRALDRIPSSEFRDYAYAPYVRERGDPFLRRYDRRRSPEELLHLALAARPGMRMVSDALQRRGLTGFVAFLRRDLPRPFRHIYVGAHSWAGDVLELVDVFEQRKREIVFEMVQAMFCVGEDAFNRWDVLPRPTHRGGDRIPAALHLKGCPLGTEMARPFLRLIKECLNSRIPKGEPRIETVTAPKHFHLARILSRRAGRPGMIEYMVHNFEVSSKTEWTTRAEALEGFAGATNLQDIDGSAIPRPQWERWIPQEPWAPRTMGKPEYPIRFEAAHPLFNRPLPLYAAFTQERRFAFNHHPPYSTPHWKDYLPLDVADIPSTEAEQREAIRRAILQGRNLDDHYRPSHPYPYWRRLGFKSLDEFIDGHEFEFTKDQQGVVCQGTRWKYSIRVPIAGAGRRVFLNHFDMSGNPRGVRLEMKETDSRFFGAV